MEKKVSKIYNEAFDSISEKWNAYMESHEKKVDEAFKNLVEAEKSGDKDAIAEAKEKYERTAKNVTVNNKRFQDMASETAAKITHTNEVALNYINDQMASIYTVNYNAFGDEKVKGYSFALTNEQAVKNLANSNKAFLPKKQMDKYKDKRWNEKLINSQMLQGILQGESIPTLAKRLENVTDMDKVASIRNARTMTTSAENKGRQDSYKKASDDGVIMKRVWIATKDERTRAWHEELDGVDVDVDEPWENEYGEIMYPGDPSGGVDPANVYNCRCAMRVDVKGFRWNQELEEESQAEIPKVEEQASEDEKVLVARDYDTDFAKNYGGDYYDDMCDLLDECGNDDLKSIWEDYQTKIGATDPNFKGHAHESLGNIYVNKKDAVGGASWKVPYETTFHESGHAIDWLAKDQADTSGMKLMYSSAYKDGLFPATIRDEVNEMVSQKNTELKALFKEHQGDYVWLHENGFISDYLWKYYDYENKGEWLGQEVKYSKSFAYKAIQKEIVAIDSTGISISDLSDMLEGATDGRIQCGYGHGTSYWKKLFGIDEKLGTEAFAEMTSATVTNSKSLDVIKKYLPKSYGVYTDMLKDLASKGAK